MNNKKVMVTSIIIIVIMIIGLGINRFVSSFPDMIIRIIGVIIMIALILLVYNTVKYRSNSN